MTDKSHEEQVIRWAEFVRDNPDKWKAIHTKFINAQFQKHKQLIARLLKDSNGKTKIIELYNIKNLNGYSGLFKQNP